MRIVCPNSGPCTIRDSSAGFGSIARHSSQYTAPRSSTYTRSPTSGERRQPQQRSRPAAQRSTALRTSAT